MKGKQIQLFQEIKQICSKIAQHPSRINQINRAIEIALNAANPYLFEPILALLKSVQNASLTKFKEAKYELIFEVLLPSSVEGQEEAVKLLGQCFQLSNNKPYLCRLFWEKAHEQADWSSNWNIQLLIELFRFLLRQIQENKIEQWKQIIRIIIELPLLSDQINESLKNLFKQSYQALLLAVLSQDIEKELILLLYHHMGEKILSKLSNPLSLANYCLTNFQKDPQCQIQLLTCLFILVGKYGLELEKFYPKLFQLVRKRENGFSIYQFPNSKRFFKLIEASLRSSRVPFKVVSEFTKILLQQLPGEESQFAFWALSFIVNLTKKHRKLLDELPQIAQFKLLKYHYSSKIRQLVLELSKNLNKIDYLSIEDFSKINCEMLTELKLKSVREGLINENFQFKIPIFQDYL